jgi:hypothetical protein
LRDYGTVASQFWVRGTGKELRGDAEAQLVALYLMTSPHANMIGVYYCPADYIAKETGMTLEGASEALQRLSEKDFCTYQDEWVCVHNFAANQIGESLKAEDKRVKGVMNELEKVPSGACRDAFLARYTDRYHLPTSEQEAPSKPLSDDEKPLRSQKQKQKQEQKEDGASPFVLPDWISPEAWDGYVAMRAKARKPMTDRARSLVIKELEKLRSEGHDVGAVLDQSTLKNWTDVYPVKGKAPSPGDDPYGLRTAL